MAKLVEGEALSRAFGGVRALSGVDMSVAEGEVLGLIGPNGSGKTTLINLLSGFLRPTTGRVRLAGADITGWAPHRITAQGMCRTFQVVQPFGNLTTLDNVAVAARFGNPRFRTMAAARSAAAELLVTVGLGEYAERMARELTLAGQKKMELARVLATGARVVLLDEVMAGLNAAEVERMVAVIRHVRQARGMTFLIVEHVLRAVMSLADRVMVLHQGQVLAMGTPQAVVRDPAVITAYLGGRHSQA